jgi:hypothetical protein
MLLAVIVTAAAAAASVALVSKGAVPFHAC